MVFRLDCSSHCLAAKDSMFGAICQDLGHERRIQGQVHCWHLLFQGSHIVTIRRRKS